MAAAAQKITLATKAPPRRVQALRGQVAPSPTGGFGGWQTFPRPHRKALTEWVGIDPLELVFSLIFDADNPAVSIEDDCLTLERMAQPNGTAPPAVVTVTGAVPHSDIDWVIATLAWDPAPVYAQAGHRIRQEVTVTLLELVSPDSIPSAAAAARAQGGTATSSYIVKKGDTLVSIAAAKLGDYTRWPEIARLNGLRDPNRITVGQRLRLP